MLKESIHSRPARRAGRRPLAAALACLLAFALLPTAAFAAAVPTPTVLSTDIYANGVPIKIAAGSTPGNTNILYDKNGNGEIENNEYLQIGAVEPSDGGYDLHIYGVYGGSKNIDITDSPEITMTGGKVHKIYGGGRSSSVTGSSSVIIRGGTVGGDIYGGGLSGNVTENSSVIIHDGTVEGDVYGGGDSGNVTKSSSVTMTGGTVEGAVYGAGSGGGTVSGSAVTISGGAVGSNVYGGSVMNVDEYIVGASVNIGGGAKIGDSGHGVAINGGSGNGQIKNGVESFKIDPGLSTEASVYVVLPEGYTAGTIATNAAQADLAKIKLVGAGAAGRETYLNGTDIKVRTTGTTGSAPTVSGTSIYANGAPIEIAAGSTPGNTNILYDKNGNGGIENNEYLQIGAVEPSDGGYDLQSYKVYGGGLNQEVDSADVTMSGGMVDRIYGGGYNADITGNTEIIMAGGTVQHVFGGGNGGNVTGKTSVMIEGGTLNFYVYGGGYDGTVGNASVTISGGTMSAVYGGGYSQRNGVSNVTGDATVTISGGTVDYVYGGGLASATVTGNISVAVGGTAKIGGTDCGIVINGSQIKNGVDSFKIDSTLAGVADSVYVVLPEGYTAGTIATNAAQADLAKIKLVGGGAAGKTAKFENNTIVVKALAGACTITFNANGGTVTPASSATGTDGRLSSLPTPARSGKYSFAGWYTRAAGGDPVTTNTVFASDTVIYAHWTYTGGGGGGSGSGGSSTTTSTVKNPDGSTTTTVTDKVTGAVTETTKAKDGTQTVVETKKDGAKKETITAPDGTKTETAITAKGDMTYTQQRPDGTRISADSPSSGGAAARVELPGNGAGRVTVSFPVIEGTVVLRVLPDGTEKPIAYSLVEDGTVYVRLEGDAELRVETRGGLFDDMSGHWAEEYADFTGARELFHGTAPRTFAPELPMTRAMLTTVLRHMDGDPHAGAAPFRDVEAGAWYAEGAAWAAEKGVAAGTGGGLFEGECSITRQELAVMLWNYARSEGLDVSVGEDTNILSYADIDRAEEWAIPALQWACGAGVMRGGPDGTLDPAGMATRAQAAAILKQFVAEMVK